MLLSIAGWGWHAENGLHLLRLILSGVLDRLPNLQVIVGHMGEGVPYALALSNGILSPAAKHLKGSVTETILAQVHVTTSGYFTRPSFDCARQVLDLDTSCIRWTIPSALTPVAATSLQCSSLRNPLSPPPRWTSSLMATPSIYCASSSARKTGSMFPPDTIATTLRAFGSSSA